MLLLLCSLETLSVPVGRLKSCRHCFCMYVDFQRYSLCHCFYIVSLYNGCLPWKPCRECIRESVKHSKACPTCKQVVTRRDIETDEIVNTFVSHLKVLDELQDSIIPAIRDLENPGEGRGRERVDEMLLPWVQGVQDDEYKSPSQSFSGSALDQLRHKRLSRSPSPCSPVVQPGEGDDILVQPTQDGPSHGVEQDDVTPAQHGQRSMRDFIKIPGLHGTTSTPDDGVTTRGGAFVDDILAGLEGDMKTAEKETPKTMLIPASFPSSGESNKENNGLQKVSSCRQKKQRAKTHNRARRGTISQSKTPRQEEPLSDEKRRIPARLLPWNCIICTFENKGSSVACEMCDQPKGSDMSEICPDTIAQQKSIASQAKSSSAKKKRKHSLVNTSHMIESTPLELRSKTVDNNTHTPGLTSIQDIGIDQKGPEEHPSQGTLTGVQGRSKRPRYKQDSRLALVSSSKSTKTSKICSRLKQVVATASNLNLEDKDTLKAFCNGLGPTYSSTWTSKVTHVICPESGEPAKTFKYLMALLTGAHIVSMKWVKKCNETGSCEPESKYYLASNKLGASLEGEGLLSAYEVQVQAISDGSNAKQAKDLLKAAGAKVVNRLPRSDGDRHGIIVVLDHGGKESTDVAAIVEQPWFGRACGANIPVVKQAWLRTSIVQGAPSEVQEFTI